MRRLLSIAAAIISVASAGCAIPNQRILIPLVARKSAPIPAAFSKVALTGVYGNEETELKVSQYWSYAIPKPMTRIVEDVLRSRLGSAAAPGSIPLVVENVHWAVSGESSLGVGADFVLGAPPNETRIKLEHSVNAPLGGSELNNSVLARAVEDLTDRFFFHPKALGAIQSGPEKAKDSALVDEPVTEIGPITGAKPTAADVEASGRILWGANEHHTDGQVQIMIGDTKGATGYYFQRYSNRVVGYRYGLGVMGVSAGGSGAFGTLVTLAGEIGYNGTQHDDNGYVVAPGFSLLAVPIVSGINLFIPSASTQISTAQVGGNVEFDLPIGTIMGIRGGAFFGTALYSFRATILGRSMSSSGTAGFVKYPFGDIYIQTSTGRISLGLSFQQLASGTDGIKDQLKNPTLNFTYEDEAGRGAAYSKESVEIAGWGLTDSDVLSSPRSTFFEDGALKANAPPRAMMASAQPAIGQPPIGQPPIGQPPIGQPQQNAVVTAPVEVPIQKKATNTVLAVFDVEDASGKMEPTILNQITEYLATQLVEVGGFRVVPRDKVKSRLAEQKEESHKACYDQACQIELGKALSAEEVLQTKVLRLGSTCALTATLYRLDSETSVGAASVDGDCGEEGLIVNVKKLAEKIGAAERARTL